MRPVEIEHWALQIIDQLTAGQPYEDSRVELKLEWIEPPRAARQLAGHSNAARGDPILWLIGVDEKKGVVGVKHEELADWWERVKAQFDGDAPAMTDVNVRSGENAVAALFFETDRAPYVVKNPSFGSGNINIAYEVPWREGTRIRTATRSDLVRLLVPILHTPRVEVLGAELNCYQSDDALNWNLTAIRLYVEPAARESLVLPFHRCAAYFDVVSGNRTHVDRTLISNLRIVPPSKSVHSPGDVFYPGSVVPNAVATDYSDSEVLLQGPGRLDVRGDAITAWKETLLQPRQVFQATQARVEVQLAPSHGDRPFYISVTLSWTEVDKSNYAPSFVGRWMA